MLKEKSYFTNKVYFINLFLALNIVLLHAYNLDIWEVNCADTTYYIPVFLERFIRMFAQLAVPTFFSLSGYLFYRSYEKRMYLEKLKSRVKSILVPFVFYNFIFYIFYVACTHISFINYRMNMDVVPIGLWNCLYAIWNSSFSPLWFLRNLFIYVLIAPIIYRIVGKPYIALLSVAFTAVGVLALRAGYTDPVYFLPQYLVGATMAYNFRSIVEESNKASRFVMVISVISIITGTICGISMYGQYVFMYLFRLLSPIVVWFGLDILYKQIIKINFESWLLRISFYIYCVHFPIVSIIGKVFKLVLWDGPIIVLVAYIFTVILTIGIIYLSAFLLRRLSISVWTFLNGGRI